MKLLTISELRYRRATELASKRVAMCLVKTSQWSTYTVTRVWRSIEVRIADSHCEGRLNSFRDCHEGEFSKCFGKSLEHLCDFTLTLLPTETGR